MMIGKLFYADDTPKILCVDDNPKILASYKRQLKGQFHIEVAESGEEGLEILDNQGPFAVVVADLRMPGMDGRQFLAKVKERSRDSVRIILTGFTELQTIINAINKENIFRFLIKPCPIETFAKALEEGIKQYRLISAERELRKDTFTSFVKVLSEIVKAANPEAFRQTSRILQYVRHIITELQLPKLSQIEVAAMLSNIGYVLLPPDILYKVNAQMPLSDEEKEKIASHPSLGHKLLVNIPRLEPVACMIKDQHRSVGMYIDIGKNLTREDIIGLGSQILKTTLYLDQLVINGMSYESALSIMREQTDEYHPRVVAALESFNIDQS